MSRMNGFKLLVLIWCVCLLTKPVCLSSIKNYQNDEDTASKLKNILLRKLDLEDEPTNLGDTNVPNYLLDLFETNSLFENNRILLLNNSNTIRSHPMYEPYGQLRTQNRSGFLIKFNLTLPKKELLNAGEFRLYMNNSVQRCASNRQRITINQIIQQLVSRPARYTDGSRNFIDYDRLINRYTSVNDEENLIYRQIDSLVAEQDESKWLQFDVLPATESWVLKSSTNFGLLIKSHCVNPNDLNLIEEQYIDNLVFQSSSDQSDSLKPVLLTYSNFLNTEYEVDSPLDFINKKKRHIQDEPLSAVRQPNDWKNGKTKDCAIYSMYVDFKEIGWQDWIVAPRGYDAFFCYGDCSLSVIRNGNTTNHATMQSLSNGIHPDIVPSPCCVPTEFSPITMIYKDRNTSVLKIYDEMIVKSCSCR